MHKNILELPIGHFLDIYFTDLMGIWHSITVPTKVLNENFIENGLGLDASSFLGWQPIYASDMLLKIDVETLFVNAFEDEKSWGVFANLTDPHTDTPYSRDPRYVAKKAEIYLKSTAIADTVYYGPEAEFFIFNNLNFKNTKNEAGFSLNKTNENFQPNVYLDASRGLAAATPADNFKKFRSELSKVLFAMGFEVEVLHHEGGSGQNEVGFKYANLLKAADNLSLFKHTVKNVAAQKNLLATFMPKPLWADNGSGLHLNISMFKGDKALFSGYEYAGLSETALHFIGGVLEHGASLCAFTNPSTNSYKRLVPGFEAPNRLAYSGRNRSAAIRIPVAINPESKRIELRFPDPSANAYLAMSATLMAGLDGIERRIKPGEPLDRDIYALKPEENFLAPYTPTSLAESLKALENDYEYLLKGDVFTTDLIENYIKVKWETEVKEISARPHPYEFKLYFNC